MKWSGADPHPGASIKAELGRVNLFDAAIRHQVRRVRRQPYPCGEIVAKLWIVVRHPGARKFHRILGNFLRFELQAINRYIAVCVVFSENDGFP